MIPRARPTTLDGMIAECEEAERLGFTSINDLYKNKAIAISGNEFLLKELPKKEFIIQPCLPKQGLVMLYAKRGVGKTFFTLFLACKIASGVNPFGEKWKVGKKFRVLYIDGEMPANALQERLKMFADDSFDSSNLSIITRDLQINGIMPNLATKEGQQAIEEYVEWTDVIIVDNLSTLVSCGKENEANSWDPIAEWALRLRASGKSVIFIHHAGKDNSQRGTSKKEDILDTVINLRHPSDYQSEEGARFEIHFEKSRGFSGDDAKPFEVKLEMNDGKGNWLVSEIEDLQFKRVVELSKEGLSQRDIAREIGSSPASVNRILKRKKSEKFVG